MHFQMSTDIKGYQAQQLMTMFARLSRSEVIHGRAAMFIVAIWLITKYLII